ncbi:MAG: chemotaxis protein CheD [bacterium]|nr:chemotaxis protein CheD [bacterium]
MNARQVGIGGYTVSMGQTGELMTVGLGSCIGMTVFDPSTRVSGLLHFMLPMPPTGVEVTPDRAAHYGTTGIPLLFRKAYELGARKERMIVCAVGAAAFLDDTAGFKIGKRNHTLMRKLLFKNGIRLAATDLGQSVARTMHIDLTNGTVSVDSQGERKQLWTPRP